MGHFFLFRRLMYVRMMIIPYKINEGSIKESIKDLVKRTQKGDADAFAELMQNM